jgi:hypothetical protein
MKRAITCIVIVVTVIGFVVGVTVNRCIEERRSQEACRNRMLSVTKAFKLFQMDHAEMLPSNVIDMVQYLDDARILQCPGCRKSSRVKSLHEMRDWGDYIYIPWQEGDNAREDYPLMYDRSLYNHRAKGINVVLINGCAYWDEGANQLRIFAAEHPELRVPMPEGL